MSTRSQRVRFHAPAVIANLLACVVVAFVCDWRVAVALIVGTFVGLIVCESRIVAAYRHGYTKALLDVQRTGDEGEDLIAPDAHSVHPADATALISAMTERPQDDSE